MSETVELHHLISERWSPRDFADRPIEPGTLRSLFEAARWAASCYNEQPWRFVVAEKSNPAQFERILNVLVPFNQAWAKGASALAICAGKKTFTHNAKPNRFGLHDVGQALATMMIQATAVGLRVHAMGGFDAAKARTEFGVPEDFEIGAALAIGYPAEGATPEEERTRNPLNSEVFGTEWGKPLFE